MRDKDVLLPVVIALPSGPDHVLLPMKLEGGCVNGPLVSTVSDLALECPFALHWGLGEIFNDINAVSLIAAGVRGEVDVPLVVKAVDLGCPDVMTIGSGRRWSPHNKLLSVCKVGNIRRCPRREIR